MQTLKTPAQKLTLNLGKSPSCPVFCFTSDVDWAHDAAIENLITLFNRNKIKLTIFATHKSRQLKESDHIQIGVHPNFQPNSTHGSSVEEVIDHVFNLYPESRSFRSHSYFDNQRITQLMSNRGIKYDANLSLYCQENIAPLRNCHGIIRYPSFFDDNMHFFHSNSWNFEDIKPAIISHGLKIFNFHPVHVALNTPNNEFYLSKKHLISNLDHETIEKHQYRGEGTRTFLLQLLTFVSESYPSYTLDDLYRATTHHASSIKPKTTEIPGRPKILDNYTNALPTRRKELVKNQYNSMNSSQIYATSRDCHLRELEISAIQPFIYGDTILDCGCSNGYTLLSLAKERSFSKLVGVDFSNNMIDGAKVLTQKMRTNMKIIPEFICDDIFHYLENSTDQFDTIISERLIINVPSMNLQDNLIKTIVSKLNPGGVYLMMEASKQGFENLNSFRISTGLAPIPDTYQGNESSIKIDDQRLQNLVETIKDAKLECTKDFSLYFLASRILHPLLVHPDEPKFSSVINQHSRTLQEKLSNWHENTPTIGSGKLWVIRKK